MGVGYMRVVELQITAVNTKSGWSSLLRHKDEVHFSDSCSDKNILASL